MGFDMWANYPLGKICCVEIVAIFFFPKVNGDDSLVVLQTLW